MKVIFIRHGESTANVGIPTNDMSKIVLTSKGQTQAAHLAASWTLEPSLITTSSFLRTQLTAQPTILRFPDVPVEVLPMEEFTYLEPSRWSGSTLEERLPYVESYWKNADSSYQDGPKAESFSNLMHRMHMTLKCLAEQPKESLIYAFSHGQYMQVLRMHLMYPSWSDQKLMAHFGSTYKENPIRNTELITVIQNNQNQWIIE